MTEPKILESVAPAHILAMQPYVAGKPLEELERELGIRDAIKLASNENPFGPSPRAVAAAQEALAGANRYPDSHQHALRARIARHCDVTPEEVVVGAGSNELIDLVTRAWTANGDHVVYADPSFAIYRLVAQACHLSVSEVPLDADFVHDLPAMAAACRPETRLALVCNPNNPTGTYVGREALERFLDAVPPSTLVVVDEAYREYVTDAAPADGVALRARRHALLVLRTFSKAYGIAGMRVGYGIGHPDIIAALDRVRAPFNVSIVSSAAAMAALDDQDFVRHVVSVNTAERARVSEALRALGLKVWPSQANFVLVETPRPAGELYTALLRRGVIVRPVGGGRLARSVRVTLGVPRENDRLLASLVEVLE